MARGGANINFRPCSFVLMLPDLERAERIGEFCGYPQSRTFAELLIDCEGPAGVGGSSCLGGWTGVSAG